VNGHSNCRGGQDRLSIALVLYALRTEKIV